MTDPADKPALTAERMTTDEKFEFIKGPVYDLCADSFFWAVNPEHSGNDASLDRILNNARELVALIERETGA